VAAGGVEPLVKMLLSPNIEAQTRATIAVCQLAASNTSQQLIADADGIPHLVGLLSSSNATAAANAAGALWHLESLASTKGVIVAVGGIPALVDLLCRSVESDSSEGLDAIAALLSDLARERGSTKASIVQNGGIKPLVKLLEKGSAMAQKHASCAIWGLTSEPPYQKAVIRADAVPGLIKVLVGDAKAQGYAAAALNNLARDAEARQQMVEGGAVAPLNAICEGPETWLRSQAAGILQQLKIEAPAARSLAQEMAMRIAALAALKPSYVPDNDPSKSPRRRGWDSTYGNPAFMSEDPEKNYDHLLLSPRNEKMPNNMYRQQAKHRRIDEEAANTRDAPLDFDRPHPRVLAALAADKKRREESQQDEDDQSPEKAVPPPESESSTERESTGGDGKQTKRKKNKKGKGGLAKAGKAVQTGVQLAKGGGKSERVAQQASDT